VISGVGIEHKTLCDIAAQCFQHLPPDDPAVKLESSQWTGGHVVEHEVLEDGHAHFGIGFQTAGLHDEDIFTACVLQLMMGGGESFSSGGPGKGMYSRLYTDVLNRYAEMESAMAVCSLYGDATLFGVYSSCYVENTKKMIDVMVENSQRMAGKCDEKELARAKSQLKSAIWMNLESRPIILEDIGRQVVIYDRVPTAAELCAKIDKVTHHDIVRVARKMLATKPAIAAFGDLSQFPDLSKVSKQFG